MIRNSDTDANIRFFRAGDRITVANGEWFVTTREGEEGPFVGRDQAEAALGRMIESWNMNNLLADHQQEVKREVQQHKAKVDTSIWNRQLSVS